MPLTCESWMLTKIANVRDSKSKHIEKLRMETSLRAGAFLGTQSTPATAQLASQVHRASTLSKQANAWTTSRASSTTWKMKDKRMMRFPQPQTSGNSCPLLSDCYLKTIIMLTLTNTHVFSQTFWTMDLFSQCLNKYSWRRLQRRPPGAAAPGGGVCVYFVWKQLLSKFIWKRSIHTFENQHYHFIK